MSAPFTPVDLECIARVLDALGAEIETLGAKLCADAAIVARHSADLQDIDRIAQYQHALAEVLRANGLDGAIGALRLDDLAHRLGADVA
jgi:hypothetical protein